MTPALVTFILVNFKSASKTERAVNSIYRCCDVPFEVVVVDNSQLEAEALELKRLLSSRARVIIASKNGGFGFGCNLGASSVTTDYVFFLNPDAELLSPCVAKLVSHLERDRTLGAVGARMTYPDGAEGHSCGKFVSLRRPLQLMKGSVVGGFKRLLRRHESKSPKYRMLAELQPVDWCTGADLLMRRADFEALGGFDETYFLYGEECDLQYRMRSQLGLHAAIDGSVDILHEVGGTGLGDSRRRALIEEGCMHFVRDHRSALHARTYRTLLVAALGIDAALELLSLDPTRLAPRMQVISRVIAYNSTL